MAWTQDEIDALKSAIVRGEKSIQHGDSLITYRSVAEMKLALQMAEAELNPTTNPRRTVAKFTNGL